MTELPAAIRIREAIGSLPADCRGPRILRFFWPCRLLMRGPCFGLSSQSTRLAAWHSPAMAALWQAVSLGRSSSMGRTALSRQVVVGTNWKPADWTLATKQETSRRIALVGSHSRHRLRNRWTGKGGVTVAFGFRSGWPPGGNRVRVVVERADDFKEDCTERLIATMRMLKNLADCPADDLSDPVEDVESGNPSTDRPKAEQAWTQRVVEGCSALQSGMFKRWSWRDRRTLRPSRDDLTKSPLPFGCVSSRKAVRSFWFVEEASRPSWVRRPRSWFAWKGASCLTMSLAGTRRRGDGDDDACRRSCSTVQKIAMSSRLSPRR